MTSKRQYHNFLPFFLLSAFLHLIALLIVAFGVNFYSRKLPEERVITFEILPVSSVNNVRTKNSQNDHTIKNDDAKKIEKSTQKSSTKEPKQENEQEKPKETPVKEAPPPKETKEKIPNEEVKSDEPLIQEKLKEPESDNQETKSEKQESAPKKEESKKEAPKKKAMADKQLDTLLKNLEKQSDGNSNKSNKVNREKSKDQKDAFGKFDENAAESLTNDEIIKQQIMRHWNQPIGSTGEEIIITIRLTLEIDGSVISAQPIRKKCPSGKESICQATVDSVRRAAINASPLENLEKSDYDTWRQIDIIFDTKR
ncbi:MAG: cell envelope integrity protein TolA [Rickettsiaceae bacterium]|nr:cell envelope integrity protein TolA [Rickettsiaceae bacterium]